MQPDSNGLNWYFWIGLKRQIYYNIIDVTLDILYLGIQSVVLVNANISLTFASLDNALQLPS
jgi:hypothetical protein